MLDILEKITLITATAILTQGDEEVTLEEIAWADMHQQTMVEDCHLEIIVEMTLNQKSWKHYVKWAWMEITS